MRLGLGLGFSNIAGSGGAPPSAPVIDTLAYNGGTNEISLNTTVASGTVFYELAATSTPMTGAAIEAATMGSIAVSSGVVTEIEDWTGEPDGTYWLNVVHKAGGLYSNVLNLEVTIAAFNPATIAEFVWDASDIARLWQNTAGTTAVTTTGQSVARIDNAGSLGGTFLNSGATDRPVYTVSGAQRYLAFDGVNDFLEWVGSAGSINFSTGVYMVIGVQEVTTATNKWWLSGCGTAGESYNSVHGFLMGGGDSATEAVSMLAGLDTAAGVRMLDTGGSPLPVSVIEFEAVPATGATNAWLRVRRVGDGDVVQKDTEAVTSGNFPTNANSLSKLILGAAYGANVPAAWADCRIYCGAVCVGTLTSGERANMRAWAARKVGF